ncbi:MAG: hypothetical protein LBU85_09965 [Treponema sp.]|jgi:hypothetical protein|nr:hypothetical protein [Treponema sp.]
MLKKHFVLALLFCVFVLPRLSGATVSCLVIETGLPQGGSGNQYSAMWENSLMDVFFDRGHIVSNARMIRLDEKPAENFPGEAEKDYEEARENGMEYFLIAIIEHPARGSNAGPRTVRLRLFRTSSQELINEQVYVNNKPGNEKEENESIKKTISLIAAQIK